MTKIWKGKRFISLVLSLALLVSMLPPLTLPVSSTEWEDYAANIGGTAVFNPAMADIGTAYLQENPANGLQFTEGYVLSFAGLMELVMVKVLLHYLK